jgi:hypothetical protein
MSLSTPVIVSTRKHAAETPEKYSIISRELLATVRNGARMLPRDG